VVPLPGLEPQPRATTANRTPAIRVVTRQE
jgi:hypothetical protein